MRSVFSVAGMTCGHCVSAVRAEVAGVPGVRDVDVDLDLGSLTVSSDGDIDPAAIAAAVEEAGYQLVS